MTLDKIWKIVYNKDIMNEMLRETLERIPSTSNITRACTTLLRSDEGFALAVQEAEEHWLSKANTVLAEILDEIRNRVTSQDTSMTELVKALDAISNKWNIKMGKPTSFGVSASVKITKDMQDEDLDNRLKEIEKHLLTTPPLHQLPQGVSEEKTPLNTTEPLGENLIEGDK